ncbi:porin [Deefgea piscis]|uniref:Porin n=1 Tax=Deefgea piscis TaxID=2739061 RepID=A0A6M8SM31_9NEIS|nr:porin [Deefgea piscis]QKJ65298.1 porin [Deefgea piscis]
MKTLIYLSFLILCTATTSAEENQPELNLDNKDINAADIFSISGFYSLGINHNDSQTSYIRDLSQSRTNHGQTSATTDSRVGVQLLADFTPQWSAALQVTAREGVDYANGDAVDWAFLRYRPNENWSIRAGRLSVDMFMLSDFRNVGYTYPWVRPVQDFYGLIPFFQYNGADIQYRQQLGDGEIKLKGNMGRISTTLRSGVGDFRVHGDQLASASLEWSDEHFHLRSSIGQMNLQGKVPGSDLLSNGLAQLSPFWPSANQIQQDLKINGRLKFLLLGASYDNGPWWLQGEWGRVHSETAIYGHMEGAYISAAYRIDAFQPYITLSQAKSKNAPYRAPLPKGPLPPPLAAASQALAAGANQFLGSLYTDQQTYSIGIRWDFHPRMALKFQYDRIHAADGGKGLWDNGNAQAGPLKANIFSLSFDGLF